MRPVERWLAWGQPWSLALLILTLLLSPLLFDLSRLVIGR